MRIANSTAQVSIDPATTTRGEIQEVVDVRARSDDKLASTFRLELGADDTRDGRTHLPKQLLALHRNPHTLRSHCPKSLPADVTARTVADEERHTPIAQPLLHDARHGGIVHNGCFLSQAEVRHAGRAEVNVRNRNASLLCLVQGVRILARRGHHRVFLAPDPQRRGLLHERRRERKLGAGQLEKVVRVGHLLQALSNCSVPSRDQHRRHRAGRGRLKLVFGDAVEVATIPRLALLWCHLDDRRHVVHPREGDLHLVRQLEVVEAALGLLLEALRPGPHGPIDARLDAEDVVVVHGDIPLGAASGPQQEGRLELGVALLIPMVQDLAPV
mmetsp:Transcript_42411/g.107797  ORF Transcript_42411/g.107797 Transcript_42411/m.107797 type:complete len:329 (-) Transcript_42411:176-1162(-)